MLIRICIGLEVSSGEHAKKKRQHLVAQFIAFNFCSP